MAKYLTVVRSFYFIPHDCDVCGRPFDVGYNVRSDGGTTGDVCGQCLNKQEVSPNLLDDKALGHLLRDVLTL